MSVNENLNRLFGLQNKVAIVTGASRGLGKGMAIGDVKLAFLLGLILGWPQILVALYLAFLVGALVGMILIIAGRKKFGQVIAFGPFLVGGALLAFLASQKIITWYLSLTGLLF